jgi:hypothetical protein
MRHPCTQGPSLTALSLTKKAGALQERPGNGKRLRKNDNGWQRGEGFANLTPSSSSISGCSDIDTRSNRSDKHLSRAWDKFWATHISAPSDYSRRHIVMTKVFKNCLSAMRHHALDSTDHNLERNLRKLYADCLNNYEGTDQHSESDDLISLETDLFHTFHNLRFNIFLGDSVWNSAMSDSATVLKNAEDQVLADIASATDPIALDNLIHQWFDNCVDFDKKFKNAEYERARKAIRDNIQEMLFPTAPATHGHQQPLSEKKDFYKVCVISFYDSLTCDPSEAQHPALRKWQNSKLPALHGAFLDLQKHPDLDRYATCLKAFMSIDQDGANILGLDLKDLSADTPNPDSVQRFQDAITAERDPKTL